MFDLLKKELIAIEVIKILYLNVGDFVFCDCINLNIPFHKSFIKNFSTNIVDSMTFVPTFYEKVAHILSNGEKKEFSNNKKMSLPSLINQRKSANNITSGLDNKIRKSNSFQEQQECFFDINSYIEYFDSIDIFIEDNEEVVGIDIKSVRQNIYCYKEEKFKALEIKTALKQLFPNKSVKYFLGFPFDPLSDTPTGYNKQRFMDYSVGFTKYFAENEILLAAELWDYLSGEDKTMETLLEIINSIATIDFLENYRFLSNKQNALDKTEKYLDILKKWYLLRECEIIENHSTIKSLIAKEKSLLRTYNQAIFKNDGQYNINRCQLMLSRLSIMK